MHSRQMTTLHQFPGSYSSTSMQTAGLVRSMSILRLSIDCTHAWRCPRNGPPLKDCGEATATIHPPLSLAANSGTVSSPFAKSTGIRWSLYRGLPADLPRHESECSPKLSAGHLTRRALRGRRTGL